MAELEGLGAQPRVEACDVTDRLALGAVLASVPVGCPVTGVVHAAGVLDDATIESLGVEQVDRVFLPKVDAALVLDELTAGMELSAFVVFSSVAGTLGTPGQGNYAAANVFLDALAQRRRAQGRAATSLAWGPWAGSGMMRHEGNDLTRARMGRVGITDLTEERGLALFDAAVGAGEPFLVPVTIDVSALDDTAPPILRGLVRQTATRRRPSADDGLARRLSGLPQSAWDDAVLDVVREEVTAVLALPGGTVDADRPFKDLGFDSLAAVELRNRLGKVTQLRLSATLMFDHPTPVAMAAYLRSQLTPAAAAPAPAPRWPIDEALERVEALLAALGDDVAAGQAAEERLGVFQARVRTLLPTAGGDGGDDDLDSVSDEEMFGLIDREFGTA